MRGIPKKQSFQISTTESIRKNGTVYAHVYFTDAGKSPNPSDVSYAPPLFSRSHSLVRYVKRHVIKEKKNLLSGKIDEEYLQRKKLEEETGLSLFEEHILSHWKGNLTISLVQDNAAYPRGGIPDPIKKHMQFDKAGNYLPVVYFNDFWVLSEDLTEINETVTSLSLDVTYEPISLMKWSFMSQMDESFSVQSEMMDSDPEDVKRILMDNHPYVLAGTMVISLLHTVLDVLAFKNEISFWKNRKSMEGLSVRSIYINVACNIIVLLYLLDNDETSYLILFSCFLGVLIEAWKLTKAVKVTITWNGMIPIPKFTDKQSYTSKTKEHDLYIMKYLYYLLFSLVIGYAIYSLMYENHKSWYSWIISSLAGCVYTFGFVMMTPQLFINYKLKSVAHLPWRTFVYKAVNTFIDDLFAFLIRMPTMHRLRVFRDDLVFIIYLYQRWIYPVDPNRLEVGGEFTDVNVAELEEIKKELEEKEKKNNGNQPEKDGKEKQE
eukprot:TRINITY_DN4747_c0_g1_i2.p1 TRINITY_DN4747_c0_g1~~TRINITY_DN4747_c0_g1_i2.p1  ORF type:complete len:491 (-),score=92.16 TRINITY_DN4747_c0_g1_i2:37-1509(-)